MKTLTILFESPNVFYAVIDGVNIRIDNPEILHELRDYRKNCTCPCHGRIPMMHFTACCDGGKEFLKPGDIFQVEGFEYEVNIDYIPISRGFSYKKEGSDQIKQCDLVKDGIGYYDNGKVAILKLAKEEEPKQKLDTTKIEIIDALFEFVNRTDRETIKRSEFYELAVLIESKLKK